jgi:hypothetical protein
VLGALSLGQKQLSLDVDHSSPTTAVDNSLTTTAVDHSLPTTALDHSLPTAAINVDHSPSSTAEFQMHENIPS